MTKKCNQGESIEDEFWDQLLHVRWMEQRDIHDNFDAETKMKNTVLGLIKTAERESGAILLQKELFRNILKDSKVDNEIIENIFFFAQGFKRVLFKARFVLEKKKNL
jgi:hypothetical protein